MTIKKGKVKKYLKISLLTLVVLVVGYAIFFGSSIAINWNKIKVENPNGSAPFLKFGNNMKPSDLNSEGDSRINILLLGKGGSGHPGGELTDTIQIVSIDPQEKGAVVVSIPRDLRVKLDKNTYSKINAVYAKGAQKGFESGIASIEKTVSELVDLPIHYFVMADFSGFTKFVDSLGGLDIYVTKAVNDPLYPDDELEGYDPFSISVGQKHLNGETALKYARSRETTSDFDRSRRQQEIMMAVKQELLSAGVLTNPVKITKLMDIIGDHVKTDMGVGSIQSLAKIAKDIESDKVNSLILDYTNALAPTETSDIIPKGGDYSIIKETVHSFIKDPYLNKENAKIAIKNGTKVAGEASKLEKILKSYGYNIVSVDKADAAAKTIIYDYSGSKKPFTVKFLEQRLKAKVVSKKDTKKDVDIEIIIGQDFKLPEGS